MLNLGPWRQQTSKTKAFTNKNIHICIRLLLCIIIKVLDYYIILEILNNIRLLLNLLLYLGFEPKKNLKKKKTLNENERNTKIFWLLVKKTQIFDPVQFSKYRMVWFFKYSRVNCNFGILSNRSGISSSLSVQSSVWTIF